LAVPTLYEWAGGAEALDRLTTIFYRRVREDEAAAGGSLSRCRSARRAIRRSRADRPPTTAPPVRSDRSRSSLTTAARFRSARFGKFIDTHRELTHVRTKAGSPGQDGVRERAFGSLKYERLYLEDIGEVTERSHAERYWQEFNHLRHHQALCWHRQFDVHLGIANPTEPNTAPWSSASSSSRSTRPSRPTSTCT
jgi:hypothetical protein